MKRERKRLRPNDDELSFGQENSKKKLPRAQETLTTFFRVPRRTALPSTPPLSFALCRGWFWYRRCGPLGCHVHLGRVAVVVVFHSVHMSSLNRHSKSKKEKHPPPTPTPSTALSCHRWHWRILVRCTGADSKQ